MIVGLHIVASKDIKKVALNVAYSLTSLQSSAMLQGTDLFMSKWTTETVHLGSLSIAEILF